MNKEEILENNGLGPWMKTHPVYAAQIFECMDIYAKQFENQTSHFPQLAEARHEAKVLKEWWGLAEGNLVTLTARLARATTALEQITLSCQRMLDNPNIAGICKIAEDGLKDKTDSKPTK